MILNIEDIPYVVITNGKTDESKRILETLEKKPEKTGKKTKIGR